MTDNTRKALWSPKDGFINKPTAEGLLLKLAVPEQAEDAARIIGENTVKILRSPGGAGRQEAEKYISSN